MNIDPELYKKLIVTFKAELEENTQAMTEGLLSLEKDISDADKNIIIESIFRSAHNIKGAARGIGANDISEIAHKIESIFASIQKQEKAISKSLIDLCLESLDKMLAAMQSFVDQKPLAFNLSDLLSRLAGNPVEKLAAALPEKKPNQPATEISSRDTIRVDVARIDKVSALTEETQINKIAIEDYQSEINRLATQAKLFSLSWKQLLPIMQLYLKKDTGDNLQHLLNNANDDIQSLSESVEKLDKNLKTQLNEFSIVINSLQNEVRLLRLVPASYLFSTLPRYARDLANQLNKQINFEIKGDDISMDSLILDGLRDPMIHMIRNAIDHGVESPTERLKLGKPEKAQINIRIKDENNLISIEISDDGSGINLAKIKSQAEKKKLASNFELENMEPDQLLDFIFYPGFTTKEIITDVSGRGVGLDVVKNQITKLKGTVAIKTTEGKGTTILLQLPLTLSSERGLLVRTSQQLFVIPTHAVEHVMTLSLPTIIEVEGTQAIMLNDRPIPLRSLAATLSLPAKEIQASSTIFAVAVKSERNIAALVVDEIIGEREIVIKSLTKPLAHSPCISGATLLERNQLVPVLNANDLLKKALQGRVSHRVHIEATSEKSQEKQRVLVVDDSITTRTLEKNILESNHYDVTIAVNGKEAWDVLQKETFELVITDVKMPIMDGFTLTQHIKQHDTLRAMPVIIVTSLGSDAEKSQGIEAGADAYIVKNEFESDTLLQIVKQLI